MYTCNGLKVKKKNRKIATVLDRGKRGCSMGTGLQGPVSARPVIG
jgi:hypothetical protein